MEQIKVMDDSGFAPRGLVGFKNRARTVLLKVEIFSNNIHLIQK